MKYLPIIFLLLAACSGNTDDTLFDMIAVEPGLTGTEEYLSSSFVAAGDRVYIVGFQDGSFPDQGWHVPGEMGGIWDHPIKLMDGYLLHIENDDSINWCTTDARSFTNYPFGNVHEFVREKRNLEVKRFQFVPDQMEGVIISYEISNTASIEQRLNLTFTGMSDLSPVWLWDSLKITDGQDKVIWNESQQLLEFSDQKNDWHALIGADGSWKRSEASPCQYKRKGKGIDGSISTSLIIPANTSKVLNFYLTGSFTSKKEAAATFNKLKSSRVSLLKKKISKYSKLANGNKLIIPDKGLSRMYRWTKYNTQWLVRDVPELGRGLSAGIPDYPWWFGTDNGYTIQGLLAAGMHEEALSTIDLIFKLSKQVNGESGKIMHEASTNGVVFNPGNLNTTPNFIYALWKAYEWTGDPEILSHYDDVKHGIQWIESQDKDRNGYPDGPGMMEIHGLHTEMIDVVVYLIKAYQAAANFAIVMKDEIRKKQYQEKAATLIAKLNDEWWVEDFGSYADFRASRTEALELIDAAIIRLDTINKPWSSLELENTRKQVLESPDEISGFVVHHNWVVNTPMEMGVADEKKAQIALKTARKYRNRFGMFVTGIDRDTAQEKAEKWKAFSYVGAVMTLPTGVQALGEARYGNPDEALEYLKMLENSFGYALPGSMYEVSPDFGMIAQAWNIYAVALPIVQHFFGVYPIAYDQKVVVAPNMPRAWNNASLENIAVGDNQIGIVFERTASSLEYIITQTKSDWTLAFEVENTGKILVNGRPVLPDSSDDRIGIELSGKENKITLLR